MLAEWVVSARRKLFLWGKCEVHLLFETVHFVDLNYDFISEFDDATAAAADEMVARGFENKEIVLDG